MAITKLYKYLKSEVNSHVWNCRKNKESSSLYIQKWRVPDPIPRDIEVIFRFPGEFDLNEKLYAARTFQDLPELKNQPILRTVFRFREHTETVSFSVHGEERPFDRIYVPRSVLLGKENVEQLQIIVSWSNGSNKNVNEVLVSTKSLQEKKALFLKHELNQQSIHFRDIIAWNDEMFQVVLGNDEKLTYRVLDLEGGITGVKFVALKYE